MGVDLLIAKAYGFVVPADELDGWFLKMKNESKYADVEKKLDGNFADLFHPESDSAQVGMLTQDFYGAKKTHVLIYDRKTYEELANYKVGGSPLRAWTEYPGAAEAHLFGGAKQPFACPLEQVFMPQNIEEEQKVIMDRMLKWLESEPKNQLKQLAKWLCARPSPCFSQWLFSAFH